MELAGAPWKPEGLCGDLCGQKVFAEVFAEVFTWESSLERVSSPRRHLPGSSTTLAPAALAHDVRYFMGDTDDRNDERHERHEWSFCLNILCNIYIYILSFLYLYLYIYIYAHTTP